MRVEVFKGFRRGLEVPDYMGLEKLLGRRVLVFGLQGLETQKLCRARPQKSSLAVAAASGACLGLRV